MVHKYFAGQIPKIDSKVEDELKLGLKSAALTTVDKYTESMKEFAFHKALIAVWTFIGEMNKYIDLTAPWMLAKKKSSRQQLKVVIYNLLEGLRIISGLIYPVMPGTAETMQKHLGLDYTKPFYKLKFLKLKSPVW